MAINSDTVTSIIAGFFLFLIATVVLLNVAFFTGYQKGYEAGYKACEAVHSTEQVNLPEWLRKHVRERLQASEGLSYGPMYSKPNLESRGRVGW